MLDDDNYCESIKNIITQQSVGAEYAVAVTGDNFTAMFAEIDDDYMKARAADVKDISERLVGILSGNEQDMSAMDETVCLLSKLHEAKHHVNVRLDMDEMNLTAAESKATYEEIKKYVTEYNDGMKVSNLYIAQVKRKCGIIERENNNKSKSEKGGQPECPKEKEIAIEEALKYFQMIPSES